MTTILDRSLAATFFESLAPPPDFEIWEWADGHYYIPEEEPEPGIWRTSRTPYLKEILSALSPNSKYRHVVFMKGSQIGATESAKILIFFHIAHDPCRILYAQPTVETVREFSEEKLQKSIDATDEVRRRIPPAKSRDSKNRILKKGFPGGSLSMVGMNSPNPLASKSIRILIFDEKDRAPESVGFQGAEGSPIDIAVKRTTNFQKAKVYSLSTPTIAGASYIEKDFLKSDQRYYYVPCPFCKEKQIIKWQSIKFKRRENGTADPASIFLECEHCKEEIREHHKTWMLTNGEWRKHNPESGIAGFHLSALYSPLGWYSWLNAVDDHLDAIGDPEKMKVWVNTVLGETFDPSMESINHNWLMRRREKFIAPVQPGALVLCAGVDIQNDRIECSTVGYGDRFESWVLSHDVFPGDPEVDPKTPGSVWDLLDQYLLRTWHGAGGEQFVIACTVVDSGFATDNVYEFCKEREFRRVFAGKGIAGPGRPIVGKATRGNRKKCALFQIGTDQAKDVLYSRLKIAQPGPGFIHFPAEFDEDYFKQLTAEKKIKRISSGMPRFQWVLPAGKRNEALDCYCYSLVALGILNLDLAKLAENNLNFIPNYQRRPPKRRGVRGKGV